MRKLSITDLDDKIKELQVKLLKLNIKRKYPKRFKANMGTNDNFEIRNHKRRIAVIKTLIGEKNG